MTRLRGTALILAASCFWLGVFGSGRASQETDPGKTKKTILRYAALFGPALGIAAYGRFAWNWGEIPSWRWSKEKEWGYRSDSGGSDKFGHAFAHYTLARALYEIFNYTEDGKPRKWLYAGLSSAAIGTLIEIGDAFTDKYGFSWGDLTANLIGVAFGLFLEASPKADALVGMSWEYYPSRGFRQSSESWFKGFTVDNTGWKFLLNFKPAGLDDFGLRLPKALHYITLDVGFYVRGYTKYDRSLGIKNMRYLFAGASLNLSQIFRGIFKNKVFFGNILPYGFKYYHIPLGFKSRLAID